MNARIGLLSFVIFVATIPLANWTLHRYGFVDVPGLGPVASGVAWVGLAFVARDVVQLTLGKAITLSGIALGVLLSLWLADPGLAYASGAAFALSELLDFAVYTPLADRRFVLAVALSSFAGALLDSALFLRLAFHGYHGWWQLAVAKSVIVAVVTPLAWTARRTMRPKVALS